MNVHNSAHNDGELESSIYSLTCVRELCTVLISNAGVLKVEARHVTVDTELSTGGVRHSQAKIVRVVWSWGLIKKGSSMGPGLYINHLL